MNASKISEFLCCPNCVPEKDITLENHMILCDECGHVGVVRNGIVDFVDLTSGANLPSTSDAYSKYWLKKKPDLQKSRESIAERDVLAKVNGQLTIKSIADIGCGDGRNVQLFLRQNINNLLLIDYSDYLYLLAKEIKVLGNCDNVIFIRCSAENLPIRKASVDLVWCSGLVNFFLNPNKVLHELSRISAAQLIIGVTSRNFWGRCYEWLNPIRKLMKMQLVAHLISFLIYMSAIFLYFPLSRFKSKISASDEKSEEGVSVKVRELYVALLEPFYADKIHRIPSNEMDNFFGRQNFVLLFEVENFLIDVKAFSKID